MVHHLTMHGLQIPFPFRPYPAQLALMSRLLHALTTKQHALLESPTGSGKSMALLCSVLAWHRHHKEELLAAHAAEQKAAQQQRQPQEHDTLGASVAFDEELVPYNPFADMAAAAASSNSVAASSTPAAAASSSSGVTFTQGTQRGTKGGGGSSSTQSQQSAEKKGPKIPKVYFASRTHSQLAQLVSELKSTAFRPTMSILGSRQHYCIHPEVSQSTNKSEDCQKLLDFGECRYHRQVHRLTAKADIQPGGRMSVWDIEDFVTLGERTQGCPYFAARQLAELPTTDLVFCPYNYLLDPLIAKSMSIDFDNAIVIIDEAHNVEDVSRAAASREIDLNDLRHTELELTRMLDTFGEGSDRTTHFVAVRNIVSALIQWGQDAITSIKPAAASSLNGRPSHSDPELTTLTGEECVNVLGTMGVTPTSLKGILKSIDNVCTKPQDADKLEPHVNGIASRVLESLASVWEFLFASNMKYVRDYRMVLKRDRNPPPSNTPGAARSRAPDAPALLLCFWCLNPAVAFSRLASSARSVVLTSGTLAPMASFSTELGVPFNIRLEAPHVIDRSQVLAHVISRGPTGHPLNATFKNADDVHFQDELGLLIESICQQTPAGGVLAFLPSYSLLDKVVTRWKETKFWQRLNATKLCLIEPKGTGPAFDKAMERFTQANAPKAAATAAAAKKGGRRRKVTASQQTDGESQEMDDDSPSQTPSSSYSSRGLPKFLAKASTNATQTGGLFLAVNRGKISEGIDFADYQARSVIVVGIPFPNCKDSQVVLKKAHNDTQKRAVNEAMLTGNQWYALQAYRTVNQALGRAIRHRWDYGAIFLVDERYHDPKVQQSLSKWIQPSLLQVPLSFSVVMEQTAEFFARWSAKPPAPPTPESSTQASAAPASAPTPDDPNQKTMAHFFDRSNNTSPTAPAAAPSATAPSTAAPAASATTSRTKPELIDLDAEDENGVEEEDIALPPLQHKRSQPLTTVVTTAHAPRSPQRTRAKIDVAYQHEPEETKERAHPAPALPAMRSARLTPPPPPPAAAVVPSPRKAAAPQPPTHLALSCRQCTNALAALPIVQVVANAPPYQQQIDTSYFVGTVTSALHQLRGEIASILPPPIPAQVSALVCSAFALQPTAAGTFGWIGYPCALPEGLPVQPFLSAQFYNIWSEADQICYQPLCCLACKAFVGVQILADRRDGTLQFEEGCWIAQDLITIAPTAMDVPPPMLMDSEPQMAPVSPPLPPIPTRPLSERQAFASPESGLASSPFTPLSMPTLESRSEIQAKVMQQQRRKAPSPVPLAAPLLADEPAVLLPPATSSNGGGKKRVSAAAAIAALSASVSPPITLASTSTAAPLPSATTSHLPNPHALVDITPNVNKQRTPSASPPPKKQRRQSPPEPTTNTLAPPHPAAKPKAKPVECIDLDEDDGDFLSTPAEASPHVSPLKRPAALAVTKPPAFSKKLVKHRSFV